VPLPDLDRLPVHGDGYSVSGPLLCWHRPQLANADLLRMLEEQENVPSVSSDDRGDHVRGQKTCRVSELEREREQR
jgi:hypothetical protein